MPSLPSPPHKERLSSPSKSTPTFSPDSVHVVYVLGGPGAGKGTQCANLVRDYGFKHLSAGDLLRAEQDRPDSQFGGMIKEYIADGKIVPMEVTVQLLENAIRAKLDEEGNKDKDGGSRFLIDAIKKGRKRHGNKEGKKNANEALLLDTGFPRKMDQALHFESSVCPSQFTLFFDLPQEEMQKRLLHRGETSGRSDDNEESIKKRFKTFVETSMPVVEYFEKEGKVVKVEATKGPEEVYEVVKRKVGERGFEMVGKS